VLSQISYPIVTVIIQYARNCTESPLPLFPLVPLLPPSGANNGARIFHVYHRVLDYRGHFPFPLRDIYSIIISTKQKARAAALSLRSCVNLGHCLSPRDIYSIITPRYHSRFVTHRESCSRRAERVGAVSCESEMNRACRSLLAGPEYPGKSRRLDLFQDFQGLGHLAVRGKGQKARRSSRAFQTALSIVSDEDGSRRW